MYVGLKESVDDFDDNVNESANLGSELTLQTAEHAVGDLRRDDERTEQRRGQESHPRSENGQRRASASNVSV